MGGRVSKRGGRKYVCERECKSLKEKVRLLQEEIKDLMIEREKEATSYEREMVVMSFKEADWRQERKRLREEVKELKKMVEEKEDKIREMTDYNNNSSNSNEMSSKKEWELMGTKLLVQKMKEERAWRDEAVEKWKQLYLAIKTELDDLIHRTYGDGLLWKAEEDEIQMEKLKREMQEKEETIEILKAQLASMEHEKKKKEREFDMLKQSLRIMSGTNRSSIPVKDKLFKTKYGR